MTNSPLCLPVYYPTNFTEDVTFGVFYFISGFFGITPPALYEDLMTSVAAHGYVVIAPWPISNGEDGVNFTAEAHVANIAFVSFNILKSVENYCRVV